MNNFNIKHEIYKKAKNFFTLSIFKYASMNKDTKLILDFIEESLKNICFIKYNHVA